MKTIEEILDERKHDIGVGEIVTASSRDTQRLPANLTMAKNVVQAGAQAFLSGFKQVSQEEQERRHAVCQADCQYYRHEDDRCSKCGCFTSFKSRLEAWHCPIDKW